MNCSLCNTPPERTKVMLHQESESQNYYICSECLDYLVAQRADYFKKHGIKNEQKQSSKKKLY
jgi:hypothetical protein